MEDKPLVSVIMPMYNSEEFIQQAISSVQDQSYSHWELIIIDDASTDNSLEIATNLQKKDPRIKLLQNTTNLGTGVSRNIGIEKAEGHFIAFLDADDLWLAEKLKHQLAFLYKYDLPLTFSSYYLIGEDGANLNKKVQALPVLTYDKLQKSNYVGNLTGIYSVNKLGKVYCPPIRKRQDWGLWLSILKEVNSTRGMHEPLAKYRIRKESISNNKFDLLKYNYRIYNQVLNYGALHSFLKMGEFLWEHFFIKRQQVKKVK
jgi:teichuronic acid biosynthesis glycosyltransferase TuaG